LLLDRRDAAIVLLFSATSATLIGLGFAEGGFFVEAQSWATFALAWLLAMIVFVRDRLCLRRLEAAFACSLLALTGWTALSAAWSTDAGLSLHEGQRVLLYAVAIAVVLLLAASGSMTATLGGVLVGVLVPVSGGLFHYLFLYGDRRPDRFEGYLLFEPVGYANAVGALCTIGILIALGFAMHGRDRRLSALALASVVPLAASLYLTSSRGAWLTLLIGLALLLALDSKGSSGIVGVGAIGGLLAVWLSARADLQGNTPRFDADAAHVLGVELLLLTAAVGAVAHSTTVRWPQAHPGSRTGVVRWAVIVGAALVGVSLATSGVLDLSLGNRPEYWRVAREQWRENPVLGAGAGAFGDFWRQATGLGARDAHSLYLETLAELGVVGLVLVVVVLLIPLVAATRGRSHPFVPVALAAYVAFLVHAGIDWDWEMPVLTLAGLFCGSALLVAARGGDKSVIRIKTRPWPLIAAGLLVVLAFVGLIVTGALGFGA
jgi:hypothetical protein